MTSMRSTRLGRVRTIPNYRRLITIPVSHYCEKARWALDRAGLAYSEEPHIPMMSVLPAKRARGGVTVPVLVADGQTYKESRDILEYADERAPDERKLYPSDPAQREEVRRLEKRFDDDLGPAARLVAYEAAVGRPELAPYVAEGVPGWERRMLLGTRPIAVFALKRRFGMNERSVSDANRTVDAVFGEVAERLSGGSRYLVGDEFSAADLTFAALASPVLAPEEFSVPLPPPEKVEEASSRRMLEWREHPAGKFALRLFAEERRRL